MTKNRKWLWIILAILMMIRWALNDQMNGTRYEVVWLSTVCLWFILYCLVIRYSYANQPTDTAGKSR